MWYTNLKYFDGDNGFVSGGFCVENGRFKYVFKDNGLTERLAGEQTERIDMQGAFVIPGLVDIHIHGAVGCDFSDGNKSGLVKMARHLAKCGITSFLPTSMTLPYAILGKAFETAVEVSTENIDDASRILGIHMEGPYFSERKRGAQNAEHLRLPDADAVHRLQDLCKGFIKIVDVAPELPGAAEFAEEISRICRVSVAHTASDYDQARAVYEAGARHLTHLYNAMPSIHHRNPGPIGAASEREEVTAELICDGLHVHPAAVRMAFKLFPGRICLISDALRCMGMPDGEYELGGQIIKLSEGAARLPDGTLAGAVSDLYQDMRNAVSFGIPVNEAVKAATINPARAVGWDDSIGSIEEGKYADFVVCSESLEMTRVVLKGKTEAVMEVNR